MLALGLALFLLLVAWWADTQRIPGIFQALCAYPGGDKVGHFCFYGVLGFLGAKAWRRPLRLGRLGWLGRLSLVWGLAPAVLIAFLEEASQFLFPHRSPDWQDLAAGLLGIALAALLTAKGPLRNR
jgi:VanZ family protein